MTPNTNELLMPETPTPVLPIQEASPEAEEGDFTKATSVLEVQTSEMAEEMR